MNPATITLLLDLNRRFYSNFGPAFAATRRRVQPGVLEALRRLPHSGNWLDLGCGSAELARVLAQAGFQGRYLGLDSSAELLAAAPPDLAGRPAFSASFQQADLALPGWAAGLPAAAWEIVTSFAVLHHLPGVELRRQVLRQVRNLLAPEGRLVHSVWQFHHSPKLLERRQPWERAGLSPADVEPGDTLLDWRYALPGQPEQVGLRYVHLFSSGELAGLAAACGFEIMAEYESDGAGGRLGLYQVWRALDLADAHLATV
jgi:SAM-dependent methyltransferase